MYTLFILFSCSRAAKIFCGGIRLHPVRRGETQRAASLREPVLHLKHRIVIEGGGRGARRDRRRGAGAMLTGAKLAGALQ